MLLVQCGRRARSFAKHNSTTGGLKDCPVPAIRFDPYYFLRKTQYIFDPVK